MSEDTNCIVAIGCFFLFILCSSSFDLSRLQPFTYYPSSRSRSLFHTSVARPPTQPLSDIFPQSVPVYPLPDSAFVFKFFQAAERLTWIAHDASDALSLATGQETVPALGRAPEMSSMDPALLQDIRTAPASSVRECNPTAPVLNSEVFQEEVSDIAQVHCENELFEFELTDHPPLLNVKGNLRRKIEFWKRIGTSEFILNVIEKGYMLPFLSLPEPAVFRNNRSSLAHAEFVEDAVRELVESGRVVEVDVPPLVVNPLSVSVQASGKKRLILDLRYINKCLRKMRVKYEDCLVLLRKRSLYVFF